MFQSNGFSAVSAASISAEGCVAELRTSLQSGLSTAEAQRRLQYTGHNEFDVVEKESLTMKYLEQVRVKVILFTFCFLVQKSVDCFTFGQCNCISTYETV